MAAYLSFFCSQVIDVIAGSAVPYLSYSSAPSIILPNAIIYFRSDISSIHIVRVAISYSGWYPPSRTPPPAPPPPPFKQASSHSQSQTELHTGIPSATVSLLFSSLFSFLFQPSIFLNGWWTGLDLQRYSSMLAAAICFTVWNASSSAACVGVRMYVSAKCCC